MGETGELVSKSQKVNALVKQFKSVSSSENDCHEFREYKQVFETNFMPEMSSAMLESSLEINTAITHDELKAAISRTHNSAPGADELCYEMFKHMPDSSLAVIRELLNLSWCSGSLPTTWRYAIIVPVPKPGKDPSLPASYRPIALTSNLCKIMERIVTNRLNYYLERNELLTHIQSGFRKGRSCIDQHVRLETEAQKALCNQEYMLCVFLDIEKAYDMIWRNGLLFKLWKLGIRGNMFKWIWSFLSERTIQVRICQERSGVHMTENGTPQGSVISPVLFNIMINDIFEDLPLNINAAQFADDGSFWRRFGNFQFVIESIQNCLSKVSTWCSKWGFKISKSKSVAMMITRRKVPHDISLSLGHHKLEMVSVFKFLGVYFDQRLTWSHHITHLYNTCNKIINLLKCISKTKWGADKSTMLLLYKALILSRLDYGCQVYMSAAKCHLNKLDRIQSKALRICTGAYCTTPTSALQVECSEMPLHLRRQQVSLKYFLKMKTKNKHHAVTEIVNDCVEYVMCDWTHGKLPFGLNIQRLADQHGIYNCNPVDPSAPPATPPWVLLKPGLNSELNLIVNKRMDQNIIKVITQDFLSENYSNFTHIYTDASKEPSNNRTAGAFWIPNLSIAEVFRFPDYLSVFAPELLSILQALRWVDEHDHEAVIFTDSMAAIKAIEAGANESRDDIVHEILKLDTSLNMKYTACDIVWVPAHVGIHGNEIADNLAKSGLQFPEVDLFKFQPIPKDYENVLLQGVGNICGIQVLPADICTNLDHH